MGTKRKTVLSIAGSDSSGGAGIQADIKTIAAHGMYAMTVVTALTAQNTLGVHGVQEATPEFVALQMDAVFSDIPPAAVKVGMVGNGAILETIVEKLVEHKARNIVVDPVMVSTSGSRLLSEEAVSLLRERLLPLATLVTPNLPEASVLWGKAIRSRRDMEVAAEEMAGLSGGRILLKGGHLEGDCDDLLHADGGFRWFPQVRVDNPNTHGTGCTLSTAIACGLGEGLKLQEAVLRAKVYVTGALQAGLDLGRGSGPLDHGWRQGGK
ncbi:bifunctional hydroxymethylpyrimidine kinase/phosphomethylpyrimidine kinase [Anaerotalea alkaliphila]|uniref:Hydroxymethylpyrimidine/phosphomethylpyrimidine kinase n=1 Tax=Anaerotalea alkaliphila TaxID=2662126 RepID=A0A7X5HVK2_9FIRM|nr:bifunctional hydroxymethylpyrimidine kinase/phosphomethylpyrimidine kinase [Anaerotalea alkaliphila]NDL67434.1 bifunctional hydroxymethylpyrimidine kinase/phosphomethylpyrimidine kinase [Anaerotalea alkaliphila]